MTAIHKIITNNRVDALQAAELLGVKVHTLAVWRCNKRYNIPFYKLGKKVYYDINDLNNFVESQKVST